jgi:hypothetical protein
MAVRRIPCPNNDSLTEGQRILRPAARGSSVLRNGQGPRSILCAATAVMLISSCGNARDDVTSGVTPSLTVTGTGTTEFQGVHHAAQSPIDGSLYVLDAMGLHKFASTGEYVTSHDVSNIARTDPRSGLSFTWAPDGSLVLRDHAGYFRLDGNDPMLPMRTPPEGGTGPPYVPRFRPDGCAVEFRNRLGEVDGERLPWLVDAVVRCLEGVTIDSTSLPIAWTVRLPNSNRTPPPMSNGPVLDMDSFGRYWFAERRGYTLLALSPEGDTLLRHEMDATPRTMPYTERKRWADEWTDLFEVSPESVPTTETIVRRVVACSDGERVLVFPRTKDVAEGTAVDVFQWEEYLGRFHFSEPLRLLHHHPECRGNQVTGSTMGPDGGERVVVFRLPL